MSIDPKTLSAEERAILDREIEGMRQLQNGPSPEDTVRYAWARAEPVILARRALFTPKCSHQWAYKKCRKCGIDFDSVDPLRRLYPSDYVQRSEPILENSQAIAPPASEPAKLECRECSNCLAPSGDHELCEQCESILKREPAAPEMPEAVAAEMMPAPLHSACFHLRRLGEPVQAYMVEQFWRDHSRTVGITPELEKVLGYAECLIQHEPSSRGCDEIDAAIAAVREQYGKGQPVAAKRDLPKARGYFDQLGKLPQYQNDEGRKFLAEIKAELDAEGSPTK